MVHLAKIVIENNLKLKIMNLNQIIQNRVENEFIIPRATTRRNTPGCTACLKRDLWIQCRVKKN